MPGPFLRHTPLPDHAWEWSEPPEGNWDDDVPVNIYGEVDDEYSDDPIQPPFNPYQ